MSRRLLLFFTFISLISFSYSLEVFEDKVEYFKEDLKLNEEQEFQLKKIFIISNEKKKEVVEYKGRIKKLKEAFKMNIRFQRSLKAVLSEDQYSAYQIKKAKLLAVKELNDMKKKIKFQHEQIEEVAQILNEINIVYENYKAEDGIDTLFEKLAYLNKIRITMKRKDKKILETLSKDQKKQYHEFMREVRETIG